MFKKYLSAVLLSFVATVAIANDDIRMLVGFSAGGGTDLVARTISSKLSENISRTVIVENKTGASGTIAGTDLAKSAADGNTLMLITATTHAMAPNVMSEVPYDPVTDFTYISYVGQVGLVLVVNSELPINSVNELIKYSKKHDVTYGSSGIGSTENFSGELFKKSTGANLKHVPFKGGAPMVTSLLGSHISSTFGWYSSLRKHIESGKLRPLAVLSDQRFSDMPNVPTLKELGHDVVITAWYGIAAPKGLSLDKVSDLNKEIKKVLHDPIVKDTVSKTGAQLADGSMSPDQFSKFVETENRKFKMISQQAGISQK